MEVIEEVAQHFHNNGLGVLASTLFYGHLPDVEGTFSILVRDTGGMEPGKYITDIKSPTFQVFIRSKKYGTGKTKLNSIRSLLHGKVNEYLIDGGNYYRFIQAMSEGGHLGKNDAGYHEFSMNFKTEIV